MEIKRTYTAKVELSPEDIEKVIADYFNVPLENIYYSDGYCTVKIKIDWPNAKKTKPREEDNAKVH